jgi:hypothetical protein
MSPIAPDVGKTKSRMALSLDNPRRDISYHLSHMGARQPLPLASVKHVACPDNFSQEATTLFATLRSSLEFIKSGVPQYYWPAQRCARRIESIE